MLQRVKDAFSQAAQAVGDGRALASPVEFGRMLIWGREVPDRMTMPLGQTVDLLASGVSKMEHALPETGAEPDQMALQMTEHEFTGATGSRDYWLFVPHGHEGTPRGLVLMLHGCGQNGPDFARGTDMNRLAQQHNLLVAYAEQSRFHNPSACWNWFRPADQSRGGEAQLLADMALALAHEYGVPSGHVYVAGMSAGGSMAAILADQFPDVFRAAGVHSGLPPRSAHDAASAFAAMRGLRADGDLGQGAAPVIVFHGSDDQTVHPNNAFRLFGPALEKGGVMKQRMVNGKDVRRSVVPGFGELWMIDGAGHAWSGGNRAGSFTDSEGPDASAEMLRFFKEQGQKR